MAYTTAQLLGALLTVDGRATEGGVIELPEGARMLLDVLVEGSGEGTTPTDAEVTQLVNTPGSGVAYALSAAIGAGLTATPSVTLFSDSILSQALVVDGYPGNPTGTTSVVSGDNSILSVAQVWLRQRFTIGAELGISGETTAQMLGRVAAVGAAAPKVVIGMGGANDLMADVASATTISNLDAIFTALQAAGKRLVWFTIPPTTQANTTGRKTMRHAVNAWLRSQRAAGRILLVDLDPLWTDITTGDPATGLTYDGTHPSTKGASRAGAALADVLGTIFPPVDVRPGSNVDPRVRNTNPMLTGNTSGVATSWFTGAYSGGAPVFTATKVARTDKHAAVGEEWQQIALTSGDFRIYQNVTTGFTVGEKVRVMVEYELDLPTSQTWFTARLNAQSADGSTTHNFAETLYHYPTAGTEDPTGRPSSGVLRSEVMTLPAGTGRLQVVVRLQGAQTIRLGRLAVLAE